MFRLANRGIIKMVGPDAAQFLHNITTNDVISMKPNSSIYNLILNSKGRYLFDFFLVKCAACFLLDCYRSDIEEMLELLRLYKMMSKVKMRSCDEYFVAIDTNKQTGSCGETFMLEPGVIMFQDPRHENMGVRYIVECSNEHSAVIPEQDEKEYEYRMQSNTVVDCRKSMIRGESFPLHYGLDKLNAISYTKGCYMGQETVARMYRVGTKKMIYTVISKTGEALPKDRVAVQYKDEQIGHIVSSVEEIGLCLLEIARVPEGGDSLTVEGIPVMIEKKILR
ncbi:MAG: folate-binding protein YgfZ [Aaplasma endosymbiont of Hyalomma asiaticum]